VAAILYLVELGGPVFGERGRGRAPWHPHHIAERYGLLTIIALGEGALGTVASAQPITAEHGWTSEAIMLIVSGALLIFGLWRSHFTVPFGEILARNPGSAFLFGYGHLLVFAAYAAMVRSVDHLQLLLLAGATAALVVAATLVRSGVSLGMGLLIVALAPAIVVVGFEVLGHRHVASQLDECGEPGQALRGH
jgi:low temperature requirement protein LtrA